MNAWIPMNVGEREVTDKKIRRAARDAKNLAAHAARANEIALEQNGTAQNAMDSEQNNGAAAETDSAATESAE
jgi:tRNA methyltransferase complex GCD14 subunit